MFTSFCARWGRLRGSWEALLARYLVDFEGYFSTELETSADLREELKNEKEKHGKEPHLVMSLWRMLF